jgi:hypothetical protein
MRIFISLTLLLSVCTLFSCNSSGKKTGEEQTIHADSLPPDTAAVPTGITTRQENKEDHAGDELIFLRDYAEKYPNDIKLMENPAFTRRLKALTGNRYQFLKETWAVETPMELKGDIFIIKACMAHNCDATNFIVVVDLAKDKMYAGIRDENKVKLYGEDENHPAALNQWKNKND